MAKGGHGLLKVSLGPALVDPSTLCGRVTPENGLMAVSGVACPQGGQPATVFYPFGHPSPYSYDSKQNVFL
jgi:hypothetical protein